MGAQGSFVAINNVVSQSVPHLHTHVVPRVRKDGLRGFFWPRTKYEHDDHAAETAAKVRAAVRRASLRRRKTPLARSVQLKRTSMSANSANRRRLKKWGMDLGHQARRRVPERHPAEQQDRLRDALEDDLVVCLVDRRSRR